MGYWNETCMLTQLPILPGEPVAGFLIRRAPDMENTTYPEDLWSPVTTAFRGDYDGYGRIKNVKCHGKLEEILRKAGLCVRKAKTPYQPLSEPDMLRQAIWAASEGTLYGLREPVRPMESKPVKNPPRDPVTLVMLRRDVFDKAMEDAGRVAWIPLNWKEPGALSHVDPVVRWGLEMNYLRFDDVRELVAMHVYMRALRRSWSPTTGAGSQDGIEHRAVVEFYENLADLAKDIRRRQDY